MKTTDKIDLLKLFKEEYTQPKKPVLLDVKPAVYLAIEGQGEPGGESFTQRIGALYSIAYTVKMTRKFAGQQDYTVGRLEAQWWTDQPTQNFATLPQNLWRWKLLIRIPEFVTPEELNRAVDVIRKRGKTEPVDQVRLETIGEGRCVQMLHVGPYDQEQKTVDIMRAHAARQGYDFNGRHHEIYISDPRRVEPARLKTILRQPVRRRDNAP